MKLNRLLYYIFLGFIAFIGLVMIFSVFPVTNYRIMVVESGSMKPNIKTGSIVMTVPADNYKKGEVITFFKGEKIDRLITHRIHDLEIANKQTYYITKGDANKLPDKQKVSKEEVIGKVIFNVPYLGYAVKTIRKPLGLFIIIIIPAAYLIFDEIRKIWQEIKKNKKKKPSHKKIND